MLGSQIITNGQDGISGHDLLAVLHRYLGVTLGNKDEKKLMQMSFTQDIGKITTKQLEYAGSDAKYLKELADKQLEFIQNSKLEKIVHLEMTLLPILSKMEMEGILIDQESWRKIIKTKWEPHQHEIEKRLDEEAAKLSGRDVRRNKSKAISFDLFGYHTEQIITSSTAINYGSSQDVLSFITELGEPRPLVQDSQTGENKESLDDLAITRFLNEHPTTRLRTFLGILREYKEQGKLISTYGEKFLGMLDKESKIHTRYTQCYTKTGRLSSAEPNLQNIPAPDKKKPDNDVRKYFIARPGYSLITCDMASAEVAIAADYSREPLLLDSLLKGTDMHSELAGVTFPIIFGEPVTISKSEEPITVKGIEYIPDYLRTAHKSVVFAKFYKAGAKRIYGTLAEYINPFHATEKERFEIASKISKALDAKMPQLSKYLTSLIEKAHKDGYLRTSKLGRIRYFNTDAYGECANAPIQGTNAEAIKIAMVRLYRLFCDNPEYCARIALNVHDELAVECLEQYATEVAEITKHTMAESLSFFLEIVVGGASYKIAKSWMK